MNSWFLAAQDSSFHIRAYQITGNQRTKETVFLRETGSSVGSVVKNPATTAAVWQKRLSGLGIFNFVQVNLLRDTVFIQVAEKIYTWGMPRLEWADRNFNVWWQTRDPDRLIYGGTLYANNLFGLNHSLAATLISGYNHQYEISYSLPFTKHDQGFAFSGKAGYWTNHELWISTVQDKLQFFSIPDRRAQRNLYGSFTIKQRFSYFNRAEYTIGQSWIGIDTAATKINAAYLLYGTQQYQSDLSAEFVRDKRNQRDYPTRGYLLRAGIKGFLLSRASQITPFQMPYLRFTWFRPYKKRWVLASAFFSRYTFGGALPYNLTRQLGYQSDYVRGYEPYVADGRGFVLGKLGIRYALFNNVLIRLGNKKPLKNYRRVPFSLWLNIFADAGKVLSPTPYMAVPQQAPLNQQWMRGIGSGADLVVWYNALARFEYTMNAQGKGYFNLSFKNAF